MIDDIGPTSRVRVAAGQLIRGPSSIQADPWRTPLTHEGASAADAEPGLDDLDADRPGCGPTRRHHHRRERHRKSGQTEMKSVSGCGHECLLPLVGRDGLKTYHAPDQWRLLLADAGHKLKCDFEQRCDRRLSRTDKPLSQPIKRSRHFVLELGSRYRCPATHADPHWRRQL